MPRVYNELGQIAAEVDDDLLIDFFDEIFVEGKTLIQTLKDYNEESRDKITKYIIYRLAEVSPGYMPKNYA